MERILAAKILTGLDRKRFVDLEAIGDAVNSPEANQRAQEIADRAVTLVKNERNIIPLSAPGEDLLSGAGGIPLFHFGAGL